MTRTLPHAMRASAVADTVDGINLATPKGFYSKSRKSKNSNKNQKLYTIGHLPAQTRRDIEKNHTNFASRIRQNPL